MAAFWIAVTFAFVVLVLVTVVSGSWHMFHPRH
jgi:hypothetical protein